MEESHSCSYIVFPIKLVKEKYKIGVHLESRAGKFVALTKAANALVEGIWATLLAKALEGKKVKEWLLNIYSRIENSMKPLEIETSIWR